MSFFGAISDENDFDNDRDDTVSMGEEGHVEVKDQGGEIVILSNDKIDATKEDSFYAEIL